MHLVNRTPVTGHTSAPRPAHVNIAARPAYTVPRTNVHVSALRRRTLDRSYEFGEVYEGVIDKLNERNHLSIRDMSQLIECIKSVDQAGRCLDILAAYIARKSASFAQEGDGMELMDEPEANASTSSSANGEMDRWLADWPTRKRFLARIAEIAVLELNRPEMVFAIISNMERFKLSTYFGKDLILQLGKNGSVPFEVLGQVARLVQQQRGPTDRGTRGAFQALLTVSQDRGSGENTVAAIKAQLAALRPDVSPPAARQPTPTAVPQAAMV